MARLTHHSRAWSGLQSRRTVNRRVESQPMPPYEGRGFRSWYDGGGRH